MGNVSLVLGVNYGKGKPYWTDIRIAERFSHYAGMEIRDAKGNILKPPGKTPTYSQLDSLGEEGRSLADAIQTRGGIYLWRQIIGNEDGDRREDGSLTSKEAYMAAMDPLVQASALVNPKTGQVVKKRPGKVPSVLQLKKSGNYPLLNAANNYHGGLNGVRAYYSEERVERKWPKWKSRDRALIAVSELVKMEFYDDGQKVKEAGQMPTWEQLDNLGAIRGAMPGQGEVSLEKYRGIKAGLARYGHDLTSFGASLNVRPLKRRNNFWTKARLKSELRNYLAANGGLDAAGNYTLKAAYLLSDKGVKETGRGDLRKPVHLNGGYPVLRREMGIGMLPVFIEPKRPKPVHADDIMAAMLASVKNPVSAIILAYCFLDKRLKSENEVEAAYARATGKEPDGRTFNAMIKVLVDNWMLREARIGGERIFELMPVGEYYGAPAGHMASLYVADTWKPIEAIIGKSRKPGELLIAARTIETHSGVSPAFDRPLSDDELFKGERRLANSGHLKLHSRRLPRRSEFVLEPDFSVDVGMSGEAEHLAEMLVRMEEAARSIQSLPEFREGYEEVARTGDTSYAKAAVEALKAA